MRINNYRSGLFHMSAQPCQLRIASRTGRPSWIAPASRGARGGFETHRSTLATPPSGTSPSRAAPMGRRDARRQSDSERRSAARRRTGCSTQDGDLSGGQQPRQVKTPWQWKTPKRRADRGTIHAGFRCRASEHDAKPLVRRTERLGSARAIALAEAFLFSVVSHGYPEWLKNHN